MIDATIPSKQEIDNKISTYNLTEISIPFIPLIYNNTSSSHDSYFVENFPSYYVNSITSLPSYNTVASINIRIDSLINKIVSNISYNYSTYLDIPYNSISGISVIGNSYVLNTVGNLMSIEIDTKSILTTTITDNGKTIGIGTVNGYKDKIEFTIDNDNNPIFTYNNGIICNNGTYIETMDNDLINSKHVMPFYVAGWYSSEFNTYDDYIEYKDNMKNYLENI